MTTRQARGAKRAATGKVPPKRATSKRAPVQRGAAKRRLASAKGAKPQRRAEARSAPTRGAPSARDASNRGAPGAKLLPAFTSLRLGLRGPAVERLQRRLAERGFPSGANDGNFDRATEAAVIAFQFSEELLPDGIAGPRTLTALGLMNDARLPSSTGALNLQVVSAMCPGASAASISRYLPAVVAAMTEAGLVDRTMLLMAIATICAETGRFTPLDEFRSRYNTSPAARPPYFDLYDHRRDLGNRGAGDGARYKGRGFVQLTGRDNYQRYSRLLGLGDMLLDTPERANEPRIAARVLACFLKDRERSIKQALLDRDFATARRLVNGGRHGLAEFTASYLAGEALLRMPDAAQRIAA